MTEGMADSGSAKNPVLGLRLSSCAVLTQGKGRGALWGLFCKDSNPSEGSTSRPPRLPEAPPPDTITPGVRAPTSESGGPRHSSVSPSAQTSDAVWDRR